jgi:hypothetical protein
MIPSLAAMFWSSLGAVIGASLELGFEANLRP